MQTQIDYQLMQYEAGIDLVALALLFLLLPALEMPIRKLTAYAKVEIILMSPWLKLLYANPDL